MQLALARLFQAKYFPHFSHIENFMNQNMMTVDEMKCGHDLVHVAIMLEQGHAVESFPSSAGWYYGMDCTVSCIVQPLPWHCMRNVKRFSSAASACITNFTIR